MIARSRPLWRMLIAIACAPFLCFIAATQSASAQDPQLRGTFVFHVYVDPLHGDNALATRGNQKNGPPTPVIQPAGLDPLSEHPEPLVGGVKPITGLLQHAPYHFRTLTGENGALAYINSLFPSFPWRNETSDADVTHVVIHCLPGVYGPRGISGQSDIDARCGLPFNGEVWPATIRDRVSLQGAAALETIFDGRGQVGHILEVSDAVEDTTSHEESFIDSITVRGARTDGSTLGAGAGIYVHSRAGNHPSSYAMITNCILTDNIVGIALDSFADGGNVWQRVHLVNNTFAWNACGLWCGTLGPGYDRYESLHEPMLINNIFDSGTPYEPLGTNRSGFEGVMARAKQVWYTGSIQRQPPGIDFNAWEADAPDGTKYVNRDVAIAGNWPRTFVTPDPLITFTGPRVDIRPFTRSSGARPGSLYINDMLRRSAAGGSAALSPHDFRLAPNVSMTAMHRAQRNLRR